MIKTEETAFPNGILRKGITLCPGVYLSGVFCDKGVITKGRRFGPYTGERRLPTEQNLERGVQNRMWEVWHQQTRLAVGNFIVLHGVNASLFF